MCDMQDHPNILKVFEIFEDSNRFYIVTEMCDGGELLDRILQKKMFT
jgi:calcium-dependent protein kinase